MNLWVFKQGIIVCSLMLFLLYFNIRNYYLHRNEYLNILSNKIDKINQDIDDCTYDYNKELSAAKESYEDKFENEQTTIANKVSSILENLESREELINVNESRHKKICEDFIHKINEELNNDLS